MQQEIERKRGRTGEGYSVWVRLCKSKKSMSKQKLFYKFSKWLSLSYSLFLPFRTPYRTISVVAGLVKIREKLRIVLHIVALEKGVHCHQTEFRSHELPYPLPSFRRATALFLTSSDGCLSDFVLKKAFGCRELLCAERRSRSATYN